MFPEGPGFDELVDTVDGQVASQVGTQGGRGRHTHGMSTHHLGRVEYKLEY